MSATYTNPIIPGFTPDPSMVFVDNTFFLVNSSFHIFPGLPIYASKNLKSTSQIDLSNATTDVFSIGRNKNLVSALGHSLHRRSGGTMECSTLSGGEFRTENFIITTRDIWANEWSDPIFFELDGIDPSLFVDDITGKVYVQRSYRDGAIGAQQCSIRQFEIDITSGKKLSDVRPLWGYELAATSEGISDIEGPHLYKKDGYYYLLAAYGGIFETHKAVIARSRDIWGPFEVYKNNPVLTAAGTDEYVQNVGHADLFQDGTGAWWAVALGVSPIGRETFLVPVAWPVGEWPVFGRAKMQFERAGIFPQPGKEELSTPTDRIDDVYICNANLENYEFAEEENSIRLTPSARGLSETHGTTTFIGKRQRFTDFIALTTLCLPTEPHLKTGLSLFKENVRHVDICYNTDTQRVTLETCLKLKGEPKVIAEVAVTAQKVQMKISSSSESYKFFIRTEIAEEWVLLGTIDALDMTACDFTGTFLGIFAVITSLHHDESIVRFENFVVS
ncbi:xylosidase/arabinosidase [Penicillium malachiteum]|uniref:xylosidase/arabinosidase n=1 Tax=Penicillium malachiteum TaxID=1324776 RepID=UPI002547F4BF|nr:xylosidase/arabinosidase [Penicillium malachiteum]KAJ5721959.1 xylosidase/arabinosidase [Penicillium malachiteum]